MRNPSTIHRRFSVIHRFAKSGNTARLRGLSQGILCAKAIDNPSTELQNPSTGIMRLHPNHQLIINRFPVIVNRAALNPSRIYHSRAPIHQFVSEGSTSELNPRSSDRHPRIQPSDPTPMNSQLSATSQNQIRNRSVKPAGNSIRNYPQRNRPVSATAVPSPIALRQPTITSFGSLNNHLIDSTNLPIIYRLISINYRSGRFAGAFAFCRRNLNHQLIINRFPVIINLARLVCLVTKWYANRPKINRRSLGVDRSGHETNCTRGSTNMQLACNSTRNQDNKTCVIYR